MREHRRYIVYILLFLLLVVNYMDRSALSVAAGPIGDEFGLGPAATGILLSSFLWTYILFVVPSGIITDRFGTRTTNAVSIVIWSLATVLTGFAAGFAMLVASRLLMGLGESPSYPACGRVVHEWAPVRERGRATALYNSGAYAGPAIGSVVAAALLHAYGWHAMFWVMGALGFGWLAAWLLLFRQPEKAGWLSGDEREHILAERGMRESEGGSPQRVALRVLLSNRTVWVLAVVEGCAVYTQYLFLTWLPGYLEHARGLSVLSGGLYSAIPYAVAVVGGIALGLLSDRLLNRESAETGQRRVAVAVSLLLSAVVLFAPFVSSIGAVLVLVSVSLMFVSTAITLNIALANDLLRRQHWAGQTNSLVILGGNVFGVLAPIVTGFVVQASGSYTGAFVIAGALLIGGCVLVLTLTRTPIGQAEDADVVPVASAPSPATRG